MSKLLEAVSKDYLQMLLNGEVENKFDYDTYIHVIAKSHARRQHEAWCKNMFKRGYVYGEQEDDENQTSNLLVDFNDLPDNYKQSKIDNAKAVLEVFMHCGYAIGGIQVDWEQEENLISSIAESIHTKWVLNKLRAGYVYSETINENPENGPLTHRNMIPFKVLLVYYPEDAEKYMQTAKSVIGQMLEKEEYYLVKFAG